MRVAESDLANDEDHDRFAAAIMKCKNYAPTCAVSGRCVQGDCFGSERARIKRQIAALERRLDALENPTPGART